MLRKWTDNLIATLVLFCTVEDVNNISDSVIIHGDENTLRDINCSEPEVELKLKEMKPDKTAGSDGFQPKVVKADANDVDPHLC